MSKLMNAQISIVVASFHKIVSRKQFFWSVVQDFFYFRNGSLLNEIYHFICKKLMKRINCCWGVFGWGVGPGLPIKISARHWGLRSLIYFWIANSYTVSGQFLSPFAIPWMFPIPLPIPLKYNCARQMRWQWNRFCAGMLEFILVFSAGYAGHRNCYCYHLFYHHFPIQFHYWIYHQ